MTVESARRAAPLRRGDPERLGPYQLHSRLGAGGMGTVYLGSAEDGQLVAIKLVHASLAGDEEFRQRFRSEVNRARQVPPFCTAEVLDADLDHEHPYLVVEYVDGPSLAEVVEERGPLSAANLHGVAIGVATALTAIHGAGVIHRDLKPRNVLLAPGSPKVIDFGIARALESTSQHTRTDQMVGTVAYMAPERFESAPGTALTPAADIFAWGVVVAYAGTGRTPFNGDSPPATAARILTQPPDLEGLPDPLRHLVELALAKRPADRPTARDLLDLLLGTGPQRSPQLLEALAQQPALQTAATGVRAASAVTGGRPALTTPAPPGPVPQPRRAPDDGPSAVTADVPPPLAGFPSPPGRWHDSRPGRAAHARRGSWWPLAAAVCVPVVVVGTMAAAGLTLVNRATAQAGEPQPAQPAVEAPDPNEGVSVIQDPLNTTGQWSDSEVPDEHASCVIDGVMRAARQSRGVYQCAGPEKKITGDHMVSVTTTLESAGSCSAVWLRWNRDSGYQVRICADKMQVSIDRPTDKRILNTFTLYDEIALGTPTPIRVVVRDGSADLFANETFVGTTRLSETALKDGQVLLGMSVDTVADKPPFAVSFANVDIRKL
jgi:predicted Ser/Thr protein kinase